MLHHTHLIEKLNRRIKSFNDITGKTVREIVDEICPDEDRENGEYYPVYSGILKSELLFLTRDAKQAAKELENFSKILDELDEETLIRLDEKGLI